MNLLQDDSVKMTTQEKQQYSEKHEKKKKECVRHGEHFFAHLYALAKVMITLYRVNGGPGGEGVDDAAFPKIAMIQGTFSTDVHCIGGFIVKRRRKVTRADINSITDSKFTEQSQYDEYKEIIYFYFLSQPDLLRWANN